MPLFNKTGGDLTNFGKKIIKKTPDIIKPVVPVIPDEPDEDDDEGFQIVSVPDGDGIAVGFSSGDEQSEIQQRQDDLEQLAGDFILGLCGIEDAVDIGDIMEPDSLNAFIETVEYLLYVEYGIDIYRPRIIQDQSGIAHVVNCMTEEEELK